jgi:chloramphenicol-sensitive protein RarD
MKEKTFKGIISSALGSLWWGVIGVLYFKSVSFVSPLELTVHRTIWTAFLLFFTISIYSKWKDIFNILKNIKITLLLILTSILIVGNWYTWIYAVTVNKLIDAAFGYFIFPILSVFFGILFLKESHNKMKLVAIVLVIIAVGYMLIDIKTTPWIGLIVALTWSSYTLVRKKIKIPTHLGLFIESAFMTPFALIAFYFIVRNGENYFGLNDINMSLWLFLAGANTLIPLALYLFGSSLAGLGTSGMIFFIAPTGQFLLGYYYFGETLNITKLVSFIIIWIAVVIYISDLKNEKNT